MGEKPLANSRVKKYPCIRKWFISKLLEEHLSVHTLAHGFEGNDQRSFTPSY